MRDETMIRAGFGVRAAAYLVDRALLLLALAGVRLPFAVASLLGAGGLTAREFLFHYSFVDVLCWALAGVYLVALTYLTGSTLGKKLMHIRVVSEEEEKLRFVDVLYRETVGRFLSGILCVGYLMAIVDPKKRGFHDWLCGTCVVYDDKLLRVKKDEPAPQEEQAALRDGGYTVVPEAGE